MCKGLVKSNLEAEKENAQFEVESPTCATKDGNPPPINVVDQQPLIILDHQLVRDKEKKMVIATKRCGYIDLICYVLNMGEEIQDSKPKSFKEAKESEECQNWLQAINEEMKSMAKNLTWKLVDLPKN